MGNPDRRQQLERQKQLIQEHLAWLEEEIARLDLEEDKPRPRQSSPEKPEPSAKVPIPVGPSDDSGRPDPFFNLKAPEDPDPEDLPEVIEKERRSAGEIQKEIRGGCFVYSALVVLASVLIYILLYLYFVVPPEEENGPADDSPPRAFPNEAND